MECSSPDVRWITHSVDPSEFCSDSPRPASRVFTSLFCDCSSIFKVSIVIYRVPPSVVVIDLLWVLLTAHRLLRLLTPVDTGSFEPSPGKTINFPAYPCRIYVRSFCKGIGLHGHRPTYPLRPPNPVFVHQGSVLLPASFRFHLMMDTLAFS